MEKMRMEYTVIYNGQSYDIPNYSIKISEKLEEIELLNRGNQKFRDKCKKMYDFIGEVLTKQVTSELIGKFEDSDPNTINILYLEIVKSYNKPLADYNESEVEKRINSDELEKMLELVKALPSIEKLKESNK